MDQPRGLVVRVSTNHEVPGSIPCSTVGLFPEGEDSRGDHDLGRLVEIRFKSRFTHKPKKSSKRLRVFTGMLLNLTL